MSSTQNSSKNLCCRTHPVVFDRSTVGWDSDEEMIRKIREMEKEIERLSLILSSSATKIQRAWRQHRISSSSLASSLMEAANNRYQEANVFQKRMFCPPEFHNSRPFWSQPLEEKMLPRVCFNEDTYIKVIGKRSTRSSQTDFRTREMKPINITVKLINKVIKGLELSPILASVAQSDIMEIDGILTGVINFIRENPYKKYCFADCHSTSVGDAHFGAVTITLMKVRLFANIPITDDTLPKPTTCIITPTHDLEARLSKIKESSNHRTHVKGIVVPNAPTKKPARLARTGVARIVGVPLTRPIITSQGSIPDIENRYDLLLSRR